MTLLIKDTDPQTETPEGEAPPQAAACPKCQAPIEPGQDWCLNCGEAQAGRRLALPGKRAAATVLALTTVLVGGAVAASYAALQDDNGVPGQAPTQVAQAQSQPQPAPAPAPSTATPAPPASSTTVPPSTIAPAAPTAKTPAPSTPSIPKVSSTPATPSPSTSAGSTGSSATGSGSTGSTGSTDSSSSSNTTADTRTSTTPAEAAPAPIKLDASAAALYDPFKRDTAASDAAKALDGDPNTSFAITVAPGSQQVNAGLTVDVGKKQGLREVDVQTKTPGFKVEIYATDDADLPPDVLDTRWAHLKDVTGVGSGGDGKQSIVLGSGSTKYRHLLLWFTAPPTTGSTVRVSELKILG
jgi:hypothetical protein